MLRASPERSLNFEVGLTSGIDVEIDVDAKGGTSDLCALRSLLQSFKNFANEFGSCTV